MIILERLRRQKSGDRQRSRVRSEAVRTIILAGSSVHPLFLLLTSTTFKSAFPIMSTSIFQLAVISVLLSLRLADAQSLSSSSSPLPSLPPPPSVSLVSTNPTAVPLSQIGPTEPASPTPTLASTPASGSVPTFIPNAPPLPNGKCPNSPCSFTLLTRQL